MELKSGSTSSQDFNKVLSDGIRMFKENPRYQNDPRFFKLCIVCVINLFSDHFLSLFNFLFKFWIKFVNLH